MKTIRNTNTARKIAALLLTLVLLTAAVPSALADSNSFAGTTWYATGFNMDLIKELDKDLYDTIMMIASLISFVPSTDWLDMPSFMAICCTLTFNANGSCTVSFLGSQLGEIDWSSYQYYTGSWSNSGSMVRMTVDGDSAYLNCKNGVLSLTVCGFGLDFQKI